MRDKLSKIGILSLGCPRNLVDSEGVLARLNLKGYPIVDIEKAEVAIINTCSFIDEAKRESIEAILDAIELKKEGRLKKVIVYGCLTQRYKESLKKELPEVDAFIGRVSLNHEHKRFRLTPRHYAYLKICEGCMNNCSFCIIPRIKGRNVSLEMDSILNKVDLLDKDGVSELNIIGQDITSYGIDLSRRHKTAPPKAGRMEAGQDSAQQGTPEAFSPGRAPFGKPKLNILLERILKRIKNIGWVRLLYLQPERINDELLKLTRDSNRICKYIDLPIQHINDRILKLMNRRTQKKQILQLIEKIRKTIPGVGLRTSIIVGFPSETDDEFKELLEFIREIRFERLGAFIYSREEGTRAYNFKQQIPHRIKIERFDTTMSYQQKISQELNKKFLGSTMDVLVDERDQEKGFYLCRSQYDAPEVDGTVFVKSKKLLYPGEFVKVKITDTLEYDLVGEAEKE